ncbi:MAG: tRNA (adenosine(37)-N6)-dimethylallyltransferase MiaA [Deltaproteobacteria bacterium]|nr:tRNA (adenosine(37)-N6)-dimethylallyltransferase MiaA [Deltaproteobacteria bacterium]
MKTINPAPRIVAIGGTTASGKTAMAIKLAMQFNAEIVSADSLQLYRLLDIGSAKPTPHERTLVHHHLIDCLEIDEGFSAADYLTHAARAIDNITSRGKRAIVVGGTGLYLKALLKGLIPAPAGNDEMRQGYRNIANIHGVAHLHGLLSAKDPTSAATIFPQDLQRIIRALETLELTGRSITKIREEHRFADSRYPALLLALSLPREELFCRIELRVEQMLAAGFLEEVRGILARGYPSSLKPLRAVGYKQMIAHLSGDLSLMEAQREMKQETKHYSKRQLTWFKHQLAMEWFPANSYKEIVQRVAEFWQ